MGNMSRFCVLAVAFVLMERAPLTSSFGSPNISIQRMHRTPTSRQKRYGKRTVLHAAFDAEADVQLGLTRAKEMLEKSKAKLKRQEENTGVDGSSKAANVPFFAAKSKSGDSETRRKQIIKATNDETGLVQADGDKMAEMSENEEWEIRSVLGAFGTDNKEDIENAEMYAKATESLSDRDAMANMWNLRKKMKTEDYEKIFDRRNFFIGEDN